MSLQPFVPTDDWIDCGTYWVHKGKQGGEKWEKTRSKFWLTASNVSIACGLSSFKTSEVLARETLGLQKPEYSDKSLRAIPHGTKNEPVARNWYTKKFQLQINQIGIATPKFNTKIGGSLDGEVVGQPGAIEIKCPTVLYRPLEEYVEKKKNGWEPPQFYHEHIYTSHYAQMQMCMKITEREWCDYIVYATETGSVFIERIYVNAEYWNTVLEPGINNYIENVLKPLMSEVK